MKPIRSKAQKYSTLNVEEPHVETAVELCDPSSSVTTADFQSDNNNNNNNSSSSSSSSSNRLVGCLLLCLGLWVGLTLGFCVGSYYTLKISNQLPQSQQQQQIEHRSINSDLANVTHNNNSTNNSTNSNSTNSSSSNNNNNNDNNNDNNNNNNDNNNSNCRERLSGSKLHVITVAPNNRTSTTRRLCTSLRTTLQKHLDSEQSNELLLGVTVLGLGTDVDVPTGIKALNVSQTQKRKLIAIKLFVDSISDNDIVMVSDALATVYLATATDILEKFKHLLEASGDSKCNLVVFAADKNCVPWLSNDGKELIPNGRTFCNSEVFRLSQSSTSSRYINSNAWIATKHAAQNLLNTWISYQTNAATKLVADFDNQRAVNELFASNQFTTTATATATNNTVKVLLDTQSVIFETLDASLLASTRSATTIPTDFYHDNDNDNHNDNDNDNNKSKNANIFTGWRYGDYNVSQWLDEHQKFRNPDTNTHPCMVHVTNIVELELQSWMLLSERLSGVYMSKHLVMPLTHVATKSAQQKSVRKQLLFGWELGSQRVCNMETTKPTMYMYPIDAKYNTHALSKRGAKVRGQRFEHIELRLHRLLTHPNTPRASSLETATAAYIPVYVWDHCGNPSYNMTCPLDFWREAISEIDQASPTPNDLHRSFIPAFWDWAACGFNCVSNIHFPTCAIKPYFPVNPRHGIPKDIIREAGQISLLGDLSEGEVCYRPDIDVVMPPYMEHMCSDYCEVAVAGESAEEVCLWDAVGDDSSVAATTVEACAHRCFLQWHCVGFVFDAKLAGVDGKVEKCRIMKQHSVQSAEDPPCASKIEATGGAVLSSRNFRMWLLATATNSSCAKNPVKWIDFVFACPEPTYPKKYKLYFRGTTATNGLREKLIEAFKDTNGTLVVGNGASPEQLYGEFQSSEFCLIPLGLAPWSYRLFEAVSSLCIPVVMEAAIQRLPFQDYIDYSKIAILISDKNIEKVREKVWGTTKAEQAEMVRNLKDVRRIFHFTDETHELLMRDMF